MTQTVLAVEDSTTMRRVLAALVRKGGFEVIEAIDGLDGLAKAQAHRCALVLTDQNMPRLDGLGLIEKLRSLPGYAGTPILVVTTEADAVMKDRGRAVGATGWLTKPFEPDHLLDVIRRLLA